MDKWDWISLCLNVLQVAIPIGVLLAIGFLYPGWIIYFAAVVFGVAVVVILALWEWRVRTDLRQVQRVLRGLKNGEKIDD